MGRTISKKCIATDLAVASTATVYCTAANVGRGSNFSLEVIVTGTTPKLTIFHQASASMTNDVDKLNSPASPGTWRTPVVNSELRSGVTATIFMPVYLVASKWVRIGFTGESGNGADVKVTVNLIIQSDTEAF